VPTRGSQIAGCFPLRWSRVHGDERHSAGKPDKHSTLTDVGPLAWYLGIINPHMPRSPAYRTTGHMGSDLGL